MTNFLKQLGIVVFNKNDSNRRKWCICWGLFTAADKYTFHGVVSIYNPHRQRMWD